MRSGLDGVSSPFAQPQPLPPAHSGGRRGWDGSPAARGENSSPKFLAKLSSGLSGRSSEREAAAAALQQQHSQAAHAAAAHGGHHRSDSSSSGVLLPLEIVPSAPQRDMTFVPALVVQRWLLPNLLTCLEGGFDANHAQMQAAPMLSLPLPAVQVQTLRLDWEFDACGRSYSEPASDLCFLRDGLFTSCHGGSVRCWHRLKPQLSPPKQPAQAPPPQPAQQASATQLPPSQQLPLAVPFRLPQPPLSQQQQQQPLHDGPRAASL
jgi:hypothetical protein